MKHRFPALVALAGALALVTALVVASPASARKGSKATVAAPTWAPADSATVHPGVQTFTEGAQCTANFVFWDGVDVYIGQAAHCSGLGASTDTDGCSTASLPLGTEVEVTGADHPGTLVYSSWLAMQAAHETNPDACAYNDLALVRLDPADVAKVNPSVPFWGGPAGVNTTGTQAGDLVYSYGNSSLRFGVTALSPKEGISYGDEGNGWTHVVNTVTPGIPGDSGSAFLDQDGKALGVLSTLGVGAPDGVVNNVSDLNKGLEYLRTHATGQITSVQVVDGTDAFTGSQVPLDAENPIGDPVANLCFALGC